MPKIVCQKLYFLATLNEKGAVIYNEYINKFYDFHLSMFTGFRFFLSPGFFIN